MPGIVETKVESDARVGDFLDDKLQTTADLHALDGLIKSVLEKQALLKRQLEDAERDLERKTKAHKDHAADVRERGLRFAREQDDIDGRLKAVAHSDTGDAAYTKIRPIVDKLHNIDVAEKYVGIIQEIDGLSSTCISNLGKTDSLALDTYRRLQTFHTRFRPLQDAADGATPTLADHIVKATTTLHDRIQTAFVTQVDEVLKLSSWPSREAVMPASLQTQWDENVGKLLELQKPELEARENMLMEVQAGPRTTGRPEHQYPVVLLPLKTMVRSIELKFRYHFEGDRPTNKLDRPDYFLKFITGEVLDVYNDFVVDSVQPLLVKHFKGTDLSMNPVYIDAQSAFITAVLPMVRHKVFSVVQQVAGQPQLLSKLMHELMEFDTVVRDEVWGYTGDPTIGGWKGLAWEVLVLKNWFPRWLEVEKDFALARYSSIINDPKTFALDFESFLPSKTVPTKAAIQVNDILETLTDTYRTLSSFSQKLRFLIDIQLSIFDRFHERLNDSLVAYHSRTSALVGGSKEERNKLAGVDGLKSLCKVYGSAEYLEKRMTDDWNNHVFFIDLYAELQDRARNNDSHEAFAGDLSFAQVAQKTSSAIATEDDSDLQPLHGDTTGGLFDETAVSYARIRARSEKTIIEVLQRNVREALHDYRGINPWASLSAGSTVPTGITPELTSLIDYLAKCLGFLRRALGAVPLKRVTRSVLATIDDLILRQVLLTMKFSTAGATQFSFDVRGVVNVVQASLGFPHSDISSDSVVESGLGRLLEGVRLVSLPVRGSSGADDDSVGPGLWEVEKRLFADNESARSVLAELGFERLDEREARDVLRRRIELSG